MSKIRSMKVKAFDGQNFNIETYDSAYEMVQDCTKRKITDSRFHDMKTYLDDPHFYGVKSYSEALDLLEHGYQPEVKKLQAAVKSNLTGQAKRISFHNDVVGYAPIVPLAIMGVPQSMVNSCMKPMKAKVIDVYYDMTASCRITANQLKEAGSKLLGAVMELEMQGYRMNIYVTQNYYDDSADVVCVKIKSANQPLDLKRTAFPLTHPAFFRVIGWDWYSKFPLGKYRCAYGSSVAYRKSNAKLEAGSKEIFGDNAVAFFAAKIIEDQKDKEYLKEVMSGKKKR